MQTEPRHIVCIERPRHPASRYHASFLDGLRSRYRVDREFCLSRDVAGRILCAQRQGKYDAIVTHVPPDPETQSYQESFDILDTLYSSLDIPIIAYTGMDDCKLKILSMHVDGYVAQSDFRQDAVSVTEHLESMWQRLYDIRHSKPSILLRKDHILVDNDIRHTHVLGLQGCSAIMKLCCNYPGEVIAFLKEERDSALQGTASAKQILSLITVVGHYCPMCFRIFGLNAEAKQLAEGLCKILSTRSGPAIILQ